MNVSRIKNIVVVICFCLSISVVILGSILEFDHWALNNENRKLSELPLFTFEMETLRNYPKNYIKYFNDQFAFRNTFVKMNFFIRHNLFRESPSSKVVLGKNGWLFYDNDGSIEDYRGITNFDNNTLKKLANSYEHKREWLSKQGIRYILVVAPNKETIYGEWMPDYILKISNRSGLDKFTDYIRNHTTVDIIDLRKILSDNKLREQLYLKTSSSWNDYAAFLAYWEIIKLTSQWFPSVKANPLQEFSIKRIEVRGGDLAEMMGGADFFRENDMLLIPQNPFKAQKVDFNPSGTYREPFGMKLDNTALPRLVVFRDCFFDKIIPFLSEHFQYSKYYWQSWNPDTPIKEIVNTVRPDIVIEEKVERFLKFPESP